MCIPCAIINYKVGETNMSLKHPVGPVPFTLWAEYTDRIEYICLASNDRLAVTLSEEARRGDHSDAIRVYGIFSRM